MSEAPRNQALQRVIVRMLFDERFRARVYADPGGALQGLGIEPRAHAWLTKSDARAWRTDSHRRARALTALLGEFPASAALAARAAGGAAALDPFFSSLEFHGAVQHGRSLAGAFGQWLGARGAILGKDGAAITALAEIESAIARAVRSRPREKSPGHFALGPKRELVPSSPAGALSLLVAIRTALGADLIAAIVEGRPLGDLPPLISGSEPLLVIAVTEPVVEALPESLADLLVYATEPRSRPELEAKAATLGATKQEAVEILDDLLSDGTLHAN